MSSKRSILIVELSKICKEIKKEKKNYSVFLSSAKFSRYMLFIFINLSIASLSRNLRFHT